MRAWLAHHTRHMTWADKLLIVTFVALWAVIFAAAATVRADDGYEYDPVTGEQCHLESGTTSDTVTPCAWLRDLLAQDPPPTAPIDEHGCTPAVPSVGCPGDVAVEAQRRTTPTSYPDPTETTTWPTSPPVTSDSATTSSPTAGPSTTTPTTNPPSSLSPSTSTSVSSVAPTSSATPSSSTTPPSSSSASSSVAPPPTTGLSWQTSPPTSPATTELPATGARNELVALAMVLGVFGACLVALTRRGGEL